MNLDNQDKVSGACSALSYFGEAIMKSPDLQTTGFVCSNSLHECYDKSIKEIEFQIARGNEALQARRFPLTEEHKLFAN